MRLTRAEERVMRILWEMGKGLVKDIHNAFSDPKPARTTVSSELRILEKKGYIGHKAFSNVCQYYPIISKVEYLNSQIFGLMERYFNNSLISVVLFLAHEKNLSPKELEKLFADTKRDYQKVN